MLIIYDKNASTFSNLGIGILKDFYSNPLITEVLNGEYNLEFEYINGGWLSEYLIVGNIIKANDQLFRIWDIQPDLSKVKILAKHIFFDLSKNFLVDVAPTNLTSNNALNWILSRTTEQNNFTVTGNCTSVSSARYVRKNVIDAIYNADNSILKKFGGELELDNFNIYVHKKRGNSSGMSILYGKNLNGVQMDVDLSTVVTKIMPQGKDELLLDELYVESPLINNYFSPFYKKIEFNDIGIDVDNNIDEETAKTQLRLAAENLFSQGIDKPTISIKIDFIELSKTSEYTQYQNLETVSLGDTVKAIIPKLNVNLETRVVKTVYDCLLNRIIKLECGTVTPNIVTSQSNSNKELSNKIQKIDISSILTEAQENATDLINHPFGGYIYISESTGELFVMNTDNPNTATQVWKWGLGGLGYSSNGINGPYGIAMTQDGKINADYITTGTLSASVIEGYSNLLLQVSSLVNLVGNANNNNYLLLENAMEGQLQELSIKGDIDLVYPSDDLYPSDDMYSIDTCLIVDTSRNLTEHAKRYSLPFKQLGNNDTFLYKKGKCYIVHEDESIEELKELDIELFEGNNYIYLESFQNNIELNAKYVIKNSYTDVFSTKAEMSSAINLGLENIDLKLNKKTDKDNIIAEINMSTEKNNDGSYIGINADKLDFRGKKFNLTTEDMEINSTNFSVDKNGNMRCVNGEFIGKILGGTIHLNKRSTDGGLGVIQIDSLLTDDSVSGISYLNGDFWRMVSQTGTGQINATVWDNDAYLGVSGNITCQSLTQTSKAEKKKNIEKLLNAKEILNKVDIYKYNFINENDGNKKSIGFIIGDKYNYSKEITSKDNDGVDVYSMVSVLWQVVKEQQEEINKLKEMIVNAQ